MEINGICMQECRSQLQYALNETFYSDDWNQL